MLHGECWILLYVLYSFVVVSPITISKCSLLLQVTADIVNALMENRNCITLDVCASLLRLTARLLESTYDRSFLLSPFNLIL